jgi:hypothetical protein
MTDGTGWARGRPEAADKRFVTPQIAIIGAIYRRDNKEEEEKRTHATLTRSDNVVVADKHVAGGQIGSERTLNER